MKKILVPRNETSLVIAGNQPSQNIKETNKDDEYNLQNKLAGVLVINLSVMKGEGSI